MPRRDSLSCHRQCPLLFTTISGEEDTEREVWRGRLSQNWSGVSRGGMRGNLLNQAQCPAPSVHVTTITNSPNTQDSEVPKKQRGGGFWQEEVGNIQADTSQWSLCNSIRQPMWLLAGALLFFLFFFWGGGELSEKNHSGFHFAGLWWSSLIFTVYISIILWSAEW